MSATFVEPFLKGDTGRNTRGLLRLIILCTIAAAAVASRLFSVISECFGLPRVKLAIAEDHWLINHPFRVREYHPRMFVYSGANEDKPMSGLKGSQS